MTKVLFDPIAVIQTGRQKCVMDKGSFHEQRLRENARETFVTLGGMWAAKIWIVLPALISLPVMWAFGEGDYIVPFMGMLWLALFFVGLRFRRSGAKGTVRRSQGFWICFWSLILTVMMFALTAGFAAEGVWRWSPPSWW